MRESRPHSIEHLFESLEGQSSLQLIQQRAVALNKLNKAVKALLPAPLHPWCRVANFRQAILVIETANANWLMRLRYEQSSLQSALRAEILPSLASIDIRINPSLSVKRQENMQKNTLSVQSDIRKTHRKMSESSAASLRSVASRSPEKLKKVLERLAARAGESTRAAEEE
ncbi:MAG: hypothetical protein XXXJIFNMEKO3_02452 [Candidatus Erwinia impunctatus]|nr:hypothetical protein XXXJIFNMEKO_02452 [Culicoides impunctatus]